MKLKTQEEIKEITMKGIRISDLGTMTKLESASFCYNNGYSQAQSDIVEQATEGFEEWYSRLELNPAASAWIMQSVLPKATARILWKSTQLSYAKKDQEKDALIEKLKVENEHLKEEFAFKSSSIIKGGPLETLLSPYGDKYLLRHSCGDFIRFGKLEKDLAQIESLEKELHNERISRVNSDAFYENIIAKKNKSLEQQKFNNAHNLSIDQQIADKIESLKSDLGEATTEAISWLEKVETERCCNGHMCGCLGKPINREYYDLQRMKEIRQRHGLGE